jgi:hypothetical protein
MVVLLLAPERTQRISFMHSRCFALKMILRFRAFKPQPTVAGVSGDTPRDLLLDRSVEFGFPGLVLLGIWFSR